MQRQPKRVFSSEVTKDGKVRLSVARNNGKWASVDIPPEAVPLLACMMLQDAKEASGAVLQPRPLEESPVLNPSGLGLSSPDPRFPTSLVVHMGKARFGVAISKPRELGQALLAASASPDSSH
jgi:hypothetical protein